MRNPTLAVELLMDAVIRHGGVVRTALLDAEGHRRAALDAAVATGQLRRVSRGWVASRDADPLLVGAAQRGVVLSCTTRAHRLGLWVLDTATKVPHVAAPANSGRAHLSGAIVHWSQPVVPRHPNSLEDGIENTLMLVARCQPQEGALVIWESALRKGLVDAAALARLPLTARARELLAQASPFADSGLETLVVPRLRWMQLPLRRQVWLLGRPVDLLIGERLVLQIDGGHHVGAQRSADIAHDAELMLRGYHVIRVGYGQIIDDWPAVQERIMRAVAQGLHLAR